MSAEPTTPQLTAKEIAEAEQKKRMLACREVFLKEGLKGGVISGGLGLLAVSFIPRFLSATKQRNLPLNIRAFLASSAFIAGFWIAGEPASNACARAYTGKEIPKVFEGQI